MFFSENNHLALGQKKTGWLQLSSTLHNPKKPNENNLHMCLYGLRRGNDVFQTMRFFKSHTVEHIFQTKYL